MANHPTTCNEYWGFYGTVRSNLEQYLTGSKLDHAVQDAWNSQMAILTGERHMSPIAARDFLDSKSGRHLADAIATKNGIDLNVQPVWLQKPIGHWYGGRG